MIKPEENQGDEKAVSDIPLRTAEEYFAWLKNYHDPRRLDSLPDDESKSREFDYNRVSLKAVEAALNAILQQRADDPGARDELLRDLSPVQIMRLDRDPTAKIYTKQEADDLTVQNAAEEKKRLMQFPDTKSFISVLPGTLKYLHATFVPTEDLNDIMQRGLYCHDYGLDGVANVLFPNDSDFNLRVLAGRHRGYEDVISIVLPIPKNAEFVDRINRSSGFGRKVFLDSLLVRELPEGEKIRKGGAGIDYDYILPGKFIEGFFDCQKGEFVQNPNFDPNLSPDDLSHMNQRLQEFARQH